MDLIVTASQVAREARSSEAGRPQSNARVYLSLVGCDRLMRDGATEKQIRRRAFAIMRAQLGLSPKTVIAKHEHGYFMVKSGELLTDLTVTVRPAGVAAPVPVKRARKAAAAPSPAAAGVAPEASA